MSRAELVARAKGILQGMLDCNFDVHPPHWAEGWTVDELEDFVINYGPSYLPMELRIG